MDIEKRKLKIQESMSGKRLDIVLALEFNDLSRSSIKKFIESNKVKVNGEVQFKANYKVKSQDEICMIVGDQKQPQEIKPEKMDLEVIYEDEDVVAINKIAGRVVHPATGNWTGTVMNGLVHQYQNMKSIGKPIRAGLIHRLDKDTSGVLLVGKTNKGLWHYTRLFSKRLVQKTYIACVYGNLLTALKNQGKVSLKTYIARNKGNRKKMEVYDLYDAQTNSLPPDARIAKSKICLKDSKNKKYVYFVYPKTGRTHQVRVHSKYINTPIIGDSVYGNLKAERMMLHAYKLKIRNPEGKLLEIVADPDQIFKRILRTYEFDLEKILH